MPWLHILCVWWSRRIMCSDSFPQRLSGLHLTGDMFTWAAAQASTDLPPRSLIHYYDIPPSGMVNTPISSSEKRLFRLPSESATENAVAEPTVAAKPSSPLAVITSRWKCILKKKNEKRKTSFCKKREAWLVMNHVSRLSYTADAAYVCAKGCRDTWESGFVRTCICVCRSVILVQWAEGWRSGTVYLKLQQARIWDHKVRKQSQLMEK